MRRLAASWRILLALAAANPLAAQSTFRTVGRDIRNAAGDILWVWSAPFHANARDWAVFGFVAGAVLTTAAFDEQVQQWIVDHPSAGVIKAVEPFREDEKTPLADLGTGRRLVPLSAALYLGGLVSGSSKLRDAAMGCVAAHESNSALRHGTYELVSRTRPRTAEGDAYRFDFPGGPWEQHSFFGGHAANAMACATFWSQRFELGLLEPAMYATALGIGFARMVDGRHWSSDTMLGLIVGHAIGRTVAARSLARAERKKSSAPPKVIVDGLYAERSGGGMLVGWRRAF